METSVTDVPSVKTDESVPAPIVLSNIDKLWLLPLKGREEVAGKVANYLIGSHVCARCVFRLLKIKEVKFYREDREVR